jgi:hypothetical protein
MAVNEAIDLPPPNARPPYVATYRFTPFVLYVATLSISVGALCVGFIWSGWRRTDPVPDVPARVLGTVAGGCIAFFMLGAGLSYVLAAATRRLALRIDSHGVTLGRAFLPTRAVFVPWPDIDHIVRFAAFNNYAGTAQFIGVRLKPGAPRPRGVPAPGSLAAGLRRFNAGLTPWPADVFRNARPWSLDDTLLAEAVRLHAGEVTIIDGGSRGVFG